MDPDPAPQAGASAPGRLAEALRWYSGTWAGWGALLSRPLFVIAMVALDFLAGEAAQATVRGGSWLSGLAAHPVAVASAALALGLWARLQLLPELRALDRGRQVRLLVRTLAWCAALLAARWPGWLDAPTARATWAAALLLEAALSFRPGLGWAVWALGCGGAAGWLLSR